MENVENLENVKSIAESNLKVSLMKNIQSVHDKEILHALYRSLQFFCKLKNQHKDFPYFPQIQLWENWIILKHISLDNLWDMLLFIHINAFVIYRNIWNQFIIIDVIIFFI